MMELRVRVVSARNLLECGNREPFCKVSVRDKKYKTRVHGDRYRAPEWNEVFEFDVFDPQVEHLHVEVKDRGYEGSEHIGQVRLPINMFLGGAVFDQWYVLQDKSRTAGEIHLRVELLGGPRGYVVEQAYPGAVAAPGGYYAPPPPQQYQQYPPQYAPGPPPPTVYQMQAPPPPVMVVERPVVIEQQPQVVYAEPRYNGGGYRNGDGRGGGYSGGEMAMAVGAGALGGMLFEEVLDDAFD